MNIPMPGEQIQALCRKWQQDPEPDAETFYGHGDELDDDPGLFVCDVCEGVFAEEHFTEENHEQTELLYVGPGVPGPRPKVMQVAYDRSMDRYERLLLTGEKPERRLAVSAVQVEWEAVRRSGLGPPH